MGLCFYEFVISNIFLDKCVTKSPVLHYGWFGFIGWLGFTSHQHCKLGYNGFNGGGKPQVPLYELFQT